MNIAEVESKIRDSLEVHSIADVEGIPFESYAEIQNLYRMGHLNIGCIFNGNVVDNFGTTGQRMMEKILLSTPIVAILASIVVAVVQFQYVLLCGIPLALVGMFMTTPVIMRSGKGFGGTVLAFVFIAFVGSCFMHNFTASFLLGTYWVPNFLLTVSREQGRNVMTKAIMSSELVFLYYFLRGEVDVTRR